MLLQRLCSVQQSIMVSGEEGDQGGLSFGMWIVEECTTDKGLVEIIQAKLSK